MFSLTTAVCVSGTCFFPSDPLRSSSTAHNWPCFPVYSLLFILLFLHWEPVLSEVAYKSLRIFVAEWGARESSAAYVKFTSPLYFRGVQHKWGEPSIFRIIMSGNYRFAWF